MSVSIGGYKSIGKTENLTITPDDRQELVQLVGGAVAIDGWEGARLTDGDVTGCTAMFTAADGAQVISLWNSRTLSTVVLENGETISSARVVVRRISYPDALAFRSKYVILDLEFWRV